MHIGFIEQGNFFLFEKDSRPIGCAWFSFEEGDDGKKMSIHHNFLTSLSVLPSVVELAKRLSEDCTQIRWVTDPQFPIPEYIQNIQNLTMKVSGKMMMRVIDIEGFCSSIKVSEECVDELTVRLIDKECPWNEGNFLLKAGKGKITIKRVEDNKEPDIALEPYSLSLVVAGRFSAQTLRKLGKIDCSEETSRKLDTLFPVENFISYFRF
jgi:predicted acetyltransferase